jgi:metallo-beta-lactamase class B
MKVQIWRVLLFVISAGVSFADSKDWTTPIVPFRISGNLYYVGSRDLASYLVVTSDGNILINPNLESSPALIRRSVEKLGFKWTDTRLVLISQAHYDHAAGAAEIIRETHARYAVMDGDVDAIQSGGATDFDQTLAHYPPAHVDQVLHDEEVIRMGKTDIVAHKTPGHTRGCVTYTMQTEENGRVFNIVIVGGWAANPAVRLVATGGKAASYPNIASDFEHTFATLKALPCDIFLGAHGVYFDMLPKLQRAGKDRPSVWIDPEGYRREVAAHEAAFHAEVARQQSAH